MTSRYVAYIDQSGEPDLSHALTGEGQAVAPVYVLAAAVYREADYLERDLPALARIKLHWWDHEGVVFNSHDIRHTCGPFAIFADPEKEKLFHDEIGRFFLKSAATVIAGAVDRPACQDMIKPPEEPGFQAARFVLDGVHRMAGDRQDTTLVFASRGPDADAAMRAWCERIAGGDNERGAPIPFRVVFADKAANEAGLQVADLAAAPIAHYVANTATTRPDWLAVRRRLRKDWRGIVDGLGLKVFP